MRKLVILLPIAAAIVTYVEPSSLNNLKPSQTKPVNESLLEQEVNKVGYGLDLDLQDDNLELIGSKCKGKYHEKACKHDPDKDRNVSEIIRSRGFEAEEYDVITRDGYILTIQRIVNPLIDRLKRKKMKPIIMQHGLMSSSADFVINSVNVKPEPWSKVIEHRNSPLVEIDKLDMKQNSTISSLDPANYDGTQKKSSDPIIYDTQEHPNSLGFYMANRGYDVFLTNSRGNVYGQRHVNMSTLNSTFWSFSFDEQIEFDLPDTIKFIQRLTKKRKLGYVGHSQGTLIMFGLLADRPEYANIIEPFVALAPVAYVNEAISPVKYFSFLTPLMQNVNRSFATPNFVTKILGPIVCGPKFMREEICANIVYLTCGFDWEELDLDRIDAYLGHQPSGTSSKNIAHYGQMVNSGKFAHFDHGSSDNQRKYNMTTPPDYDLTKIESKAISLFIASNDWLASPKDVAKLRNDLQVEPFKVFNVSSVRPKWNHIDFIYAREAGNIINTQIEEIFRHF